MDFNKMGYEEILNYARKVGLKFKGRISKDKIVELLKSDNIEKPAGVPKYVIFVPGQGRRDVY